MSFFETIRKAITPSRREVIAIPGAGVTLPKPNPMMEIGVSGLARTKLLGYVFEEWLSSLSTYQAKLVYREMRDNDPIIGALFYAMEMILRKAEWRVEPSKGAKGDDYGEFVESNMNDMSHTWTDFIAECVNMFAFGYGLFETVYKRRLGPDGRKASKYDDGLIGWRKLAPRAQETILYWIWDDEGGLQGAVQLAAPDYRTVPIPIEKLLLFRTTSIKNNPEGRSVLRNCYRPWFFKRRIEEVEGIGIERDMCGLPVLYANQEVINAMGGVDAAKQMITNIRVDDQMGALLPLAYDEKGNPMVKLELLKAAGRKMTDPGATINRYNQDILNTAMAGFIQFGQTPTGSRSLHMSATQIFALALGAFMDSVADVMNRIAIPRLMALNKMDLTLAPKLVPGEIGVRDLDELSAYIQRLSQSGLSFFDPDTANYLRKVARLPEEPKEAPAAPSPVAQEPPEQTGVPSGKGQPPTGPKSPQRPAGKTAPVQGETDEQAAERLQEVA